VRGISLIVFAAAAIHCLWAGLLLIPHYSPENSTPVSAIFRATSASPDNPVVRNLAALWLAAVAVMAVWGVTRRRGMISWIAMLPQQLLLGMAAWGAMRAMWLSHYADGVTRDRGFIMADQFPSIVLWAAHTAALILVYSRGRWENNHVG
jgi:hypothetical protein